MTLDLESIKKRAGIGGRSWNYDDDQQVFDDIDALIAEVERLRLRREPQD